VKAGEGRGGAVVCTIEGDFIVKHVGNGEQGDEVVGYKEYLLRSSGDKIETGRTGNARDSVELWGLMCSTSMTCSFMNGAWLISEGLEMRGLRDSTGLLVRDGV